MKSSAVISAAIVVMMISAFGVSAVMCEMVTEHHAPKGIAWEQGAYDSGVARFDNFTWVNEGREIFTVSRADWAQLARVAESTSGHLELCLQTSDGLHCIMAVRP